jgi:beta-N-acetylhexosaminidase
VAAVLVGALMSTVAAGCGGAPDPSEPLASSVAPASSASVAGSPDASSSAPGTVVTVPELSGSALASAGPSAPSSARSAPSRVSTAPPVRVTSTVRGGSGGEFEITKADVAKATVAVAAMTPDEQAGSVLMVTSADLLGQTGADSTPVGGVILTGSQGVVDGTTDGTPAQVGALTATVQKTRPSGAPGLLIGTDQEYGDVVRLVNGFTAFPGASQLAAIPDTDQAASMTTRIATAAAQEMLAVGVTVDFAPDADVLPVDGSESAIGDRSYGADPQRTARLAASAVVGYQRGGVAATLKHFPGIGRIAADTHETLPTLVTDCAGWNDAEAVPMRAGVQAGAALVMTGHVLMPAVGATGAPASMSPEVVTDLLEGAGRDGCTGLRFAGVAVTDSLQMQPALEASPSPGGAEVQALLAGEDLLLMPTAPAAAITAIEAAVADGTLPQARLTDAAVRVYALRLALDRVPRPARSVIASPAHQELADQAAALAKGG